MSVGFEGIPVVVSPYVPEGELYLFSPKDKPGETKVLAKEGIKPDESLEDWLRSFHVVRIFNFSLKPDYKFPRVGTPNGVDQMEFK